MNQVKIKRTAYNRLRQDNLNLYFKRILSMTVDRPQYSVMETQLADLMVKSIAYDKALTAAKEGGKLLVFQKNQAKMLATVSLDHLANLAEIYCMGSEEYIVGMGFDLQKKTRRRKTIETPEVPTDIFVKSTGNVGELKITLTLPNKEQVVTVAVEERIAYTDTPFTNGKYMTDEVTVFRGFPSLQMIELRFKALGRNNLKSGWSESVIVPVL